MDPQDAADAVNTATDGLIREQEDKIEQLRARVAELEAEQLRAQQRALSFGPNSAHWTAEEAARYILGEA